MLNSAHHTFLLHHRIPADAVLDARQMATAEWKAELKRSGKAVAFVAKPCGKGHQLCLRMSSGHCIECSPQGIAHWKRRYQDGIVYIAVSRSIGLLKLGFTNSPTFRAHDLNRDGYGGATDWDALYWRKFERAGWVEAETHTRLACSASPRSYKRKGHGTTVTAKELFNCSYQDMKSALEQFEAFALSSPWER